MNHPLLNRIKIPGILMVVSVIIVIVDFLASAYNLSFGNLVNYFYPCKQYPLSPFYCYVAYDFCLVIVMAGVFIISLLAVLIISFLHYKRNKNIINDKVQE